VECEPEAPAVDHIDLYQIHGRDPFTPLEETLDALDDCVRAGKVRYLGCAIFRVEITKSLWILDKKNPRASKACRCTTRSSAATSNASRAASRRTRISPSCRGVRWRAVSCRASISRDERRSPTGARARDARFFRRSSASALCNVIDVMRPIAADNLVSVAQVRWRGCSPSRTSPR
jgi:aryl-alcohol dehydrogenase-like predicted oxidoreductase